MKKSKLVLLSLVTLLVLTGCGKKELTCTMSQTENNIKMDSTVVVNFDGKTVEDMNMTMDVEIPETLQSQKETLKNFYEQATFKVEDTDKGLRLTADKDSTFFKDLKLGESKANYDDTKDALEAQGFTCK